MEHRDSAFGLPLLVRYRPSRRWAAVLAVAYTGAGACLLAAALPAWTLYPLAALLLISALRQSRELRRGFITANPPILMLDHADEWHLKPEVGAMLTLRLQPGSFVHPWLIVLRFCDDHGCGRVFLLDRDNTEADVLRRLRVRLRFKMPESKPRPDTR